MSGRSTTTLSCVAEQGNNVSDVGDNGIRVSSRERQGQHTRRHRKRHSERVSLPLDYTRASNGQSEAAPTTVLYSSSFSFFLLFLGILVTRKKWWCKSYEGPHFSFGRGGNWAQSMCPNHREEKKPFFFFFFMKLYYFQMYC